MNSQESDRATARDPIGLRSLLVFMFVAAAILSLVKLLTPAAHWSWRLGVAAYFTALAAYAVLRVPYVLRRVRRIIRQRQQVLEEREQLAAMAARRRNEPPA
jgi:membrane protein implicated in regulation of membrane protease activity